MEYLPQTMLTLPVSLPPLDLTMFLADLLTLLS